jgi:signal transduction histidine kinase
MGLLSWLGLPGLAHAQTAGGAGAAPFAMIAVAALAALSLYLGLRLRAERLARQREREEHAESKRESEAAIRANQVKNQFLERMSNAFRTPLNVILGFAQLQKNRLGADAPAELVQSTEATLTAGWQLLELLEDIVDIARLEQQTLHLREENCALDEVISHAVSLVSDDARASGVSVDAQPGGHTVKADYTRLKQVLVNLLRNAVQYNRSGGMVRVTVEAAADNRILCHITDTGNGIPAREHERVLEPFTRLSAGMEAHPDGVGVGLPLARFLAEVMGGSLEFESAEGEGSTFTLSLRSADTGSTAPGAAPQTGALEPPAAPLTIVYVEDHRASLELMKAILEPLENVRLLTAMSAEPGLALIHEHKPDLVLLDINLAGMGGIEAAQQIQATPALRDIPLVALSADTSEAQIEQAMAAGFTDYLAKPLDIDRLWQLLDDVARPR